MDFVLSVIFIMKFKVLSLHVNISACEMQCSKFDGHMPYLYEVDSVYEQLLKNGSISTTDYPIFVTESSQLVLNSSRNLLSEALGFHF